MRPICSTHRRARGFTLIESVVAIVVLGLISLGALQVFITNARENARSENRARTLSVAQQELGALRGLTRTEISNGLVAGRQEWS